MRFAQPATDLCLPSATRPMRLNRTIWKIVTYNDSHFSLQRVGMAATWLSLASFHMYVWECGFSNVTRSIHLSWCYRVMLLVENCMHVMVNRWLQNKCDDCVAWYRGSAHRCGKRLAYRMTQLMSPFEKHTLLCVCVSICWSTPPKLQLLELIESFRYIEHSVRFC